MKLLVGLGNPGKEYEGTRHNAGWMVLDALAAKLGAESWELSKYAEALYCHLRIGEHDVELFKPQTYMNNSGRSVAYAMQKHDLSPTDIIVVHDELDLPFGTVRTRLGGTSAGHNGVGSIIHHLGTDQLWRVRIGIETDHPQRLNDPSGFVLAPFAQAERELINRVVDQTATNLIDWLRTGEIPETSLSIEE